MVGYSPWGPKESDTTESLTLSRTHFSHITWREACFCFAPGGRAWSRGGDYKKRIADSGFWTERAASEGDSLGGPIEAHHRLQGPGEGGWP